MPIINVIDNGFINISKIIPRDYIKAPIKYQRASTNNKPPLPPTLLKLDILKKEIKDYKKGYLE